MTDAEYPVFEEWGRKALIDAERYDAMYRESVDDPEGFWRREARRIDWIRPFGEVKETSFNEADFGIRWFADGTLNLSANCLDRHLAERGDATAIIWEPDDPTEASRTISYAELYRMVCRFANALKANGAGRGHRVTIYMPMVPEAAVAMLACASWRTIRSYLALFRSASRPYPGLRTLVVTADEALRAGKPVPKAT
jgi:acetyl-CoA synthetase